jgi:DNA repair protein RadA/Sms
MSKNKTQYACQQCGSLSSKWSGQCFECQSWNSLTEVIAVSKNASSNYQGFSGTQSAGVISLAHIPKNAQKRFPTGLSEFDRVLGGGVVPGSVVLIGGDPGIGKSTLLLQSLCLLSQQLPVLYVTGEESPEQVALRAERLHLPTEQVNILAQTEIHQICEAAKSCSPKVMVIDSIQTMYTADLASAPGGVSQVRESAAYLTQFAKQTGTALFLVGHVTKTGEVAGPRVLEHIVDTVIFLEGQEDSRFRLMRSLKNRFGSANELGVFAMTETGMKAVTNPSALFLSRAEDISPGSVVMVTWEGTRPLLVEIQALVDDTPAPNPRRVSVGLDSNRLAMLLAVLHRHANIPTFQQDVFVNVVGGVRVQETSADLACLFAAVSSMKNKALPEDLVVFGEVGLSGEVRPVQSGQERIKEAAKHGFKRAIVPKANLPKEPIAQMTCIGVTHLREALEYL